MRKNTLLVLTVVILIAAAIVFLIRERKDVKTSPITENQISKSDETGIKETVYTFGTHLKNVPLTADTDMLKKSLKDEYTPFVTSALMERWLNDPTHAPGRLTSSPWPERIEIKDMYKSGDYYEVAGEVILMTSVEMSTDSPDDTAGKEPIFLTIINQKGKWLIAEYQTSLE